MTANISFNVKVFLENAGVLPELNARMKDLSPAFQAIYLEHVDLNSQIFEQSVGKELSGADVFDEHWAAVTPEYYKEKHSQGSSRVTKKVSKGGAARYSGAFPDWLMVRTGALREAMINPDALFHDINEQEAIFGIPNDPDLADIVMWR